MGFFQRRSINIYSKNKKGLPALEAPVIDIQAQVDQLVKPDTRLYGIDSVINLMRKLPQGDLDTIVSVLKHTLDSVDVELSHIIEDADDKVNTINDRLGELRVEISQLQNNIKARMEEISHLESDLAETLDVKEDLIYAEKITTSNQDVSDSNTNSATGSSSSIDTGVDINSTRDETKVSYSELNSKPELEQSKEPQKEALPEELPEEAPAMAVEATHNTNDNKAEPLAAEEPAVTSALAEDENAGIQSLPLECDEDDGIPVVQAIDLDQHITQIEEAPAHETPAHIEEVSKDVSFEESIKKLKSKLDKVASV